MIVTQTEPLTKTKWKVYLDGKFAFVLYKGELSRFHITQGEELSEEIFVKIREEVIFKRIKLRALHLLNQMDRTEEQLRTKLKQGFYTDDMIDRAIAYVKSFGYIEDSGYAKRFILSRQDSKSRKEIYAKLCQKGIAKEIIERAMEECYEEDEELTAIRKLVEKKRFDARNATDSERQKMYGYLARKGFSYDSIRQVIQISDWNA
ncbi:MAG: RecX family transcriptional regulator [Lachnospiraceae bacterium]|nr:RecX family transcriptional regulator [Lachnospiraceae bacterium]MDO4451522.1 RecX family transcriptional regulator [Lachnospiraceae bacterium]MDU3180076.1 RecX family transcriptional regulator [Lachnospiraceae bacterium]